MADITSIIKYTSALMEDLNERHRKERAFKVYNYVTKNTYKILDYLKIKMRDNAKIQYPDDWEITYINIIPKLLRNIGTLYSSRNYVKIEVLDKNGDVDDTETQKYLDLIEKYNITRMKKKVNRWAVAFNTVPVFPVIRERELDFDIYPPHLCTVIPGDRNYLKMQSISVTISGNDGAILDKVYSPFETALVDADGKILRRVDNKFGIIPCVIARIDDQGDFWGMGLEDACDLNTEINVQLTSLSTHGLYQGGSILFGSDLDEGAMIHAGPNTAVTGTTGTSDKKPELKFVSPDAKLQQLSDLILFYIKQMYVTQGLSASTYTDENKEQSGIAKYIDNLELQELREDYIYAFREFEQKLYSMIQLIYNNAVESNIIDGKPLKGHSVRVTFDIKPMPINNKDEFEILLEKVNRGVISIYDMVRRELSNPALSDEECKEIIIENLNESTKYVIQSESDE